MTVTLPPEAEGFQEFVEHAVRQWCGGANFDCRSLTEGKSGAVVLRAEVGAVVRAGLVSPGQYILKLVSVPVQTPSLLGKKALEAAKSFGPKLFAEHVPDMVTDFTEVIGDVRNEAMLLRIAGGSLRLYASASSPSAPSLVSNVARIVRDLYANFLEPNDVRELTPQGLVSEWMTERRFADSLERSRAMASGRGAEITPGGFLVWPHHFFTLLNRAKAAPVTVVGGFNHRDMHGGNILFERSDEIGTENRYFIIDFDEADQGPFGYDSAYLDAERFTFGCDGVDAATASGLLRYPPPAVEANSLLATWPYSTLRAELVKAERAAQHDTNWADVLERQTLLARIAAGMIWTRREGSLSRTQRDSAHQFAAAHCGAYLSMYHPDLLSEVRTSESVTDSGGSAGTVAQVSRSAAAEEAFDALDQMQGRRMRLVLVSERITTDAAALGLVPWSAVIDLDPLSSDQGLFRAAQQNLEADRGIHRFSKDVPGALSSRGTAWMFANGWREVGEPTLGDRDWTYQTVPVVRRLARSLRAMAGNTPVAVVVLGGSRPNLGGASAGSIDRVVRVMEAVDEAFEGAVDFYTFGDLPGSPIVKSINVQATPAEFMSTLATRLGSTNQFKNIELPGKQGWVELPASIYSPLAESFDLLHRHVLATEGEDQHVGTFQRGGWPTWHDLHDSADVERDLHRALLGAIRTELDSHRTRTVVLDHNPGAGASTLARRVAWDLHLSSPVCVLRPDQPIGPSEVSVLSDRLRQLYAVAEQPVLCVAEPSSLSETGREQLYRELSSRSTRVVLLYLRRTFKQRKQSGPGKLDRASLLDPMSDPEVARFTRVFSELTDDPVRKSELAKLARPGYERYRSPFFFGLATFDREFKGIEDYVRQHIAGVRNRVRDVLEYLSFVTLYAEGGLDMSTVKKLLGQSANSEVELADLFGDQASRLLVQIGDRVRVMHPILADEVLTDLVGGGTDWRPHGHEVAMDFIRDLGALTDTTSESTRRLLRQLFVERPGTRFDEVEDRGAFSPFIEDLDLLDYSLGHQVLLTLTEEFSQEAHFWAHLGRHQIYRVGREIDRAVDYLERAISLSNGDPIHYHVLGQVKRYLMRQIIAENRRIASADLLERIRDSYSGASEAFGHARELAPDNIYAFITHIQATVEAAFALRKADHVTTVTDLADPAVSDWIRSELALASELADRAAILYGGLDDADDYLKKCMADLRRLYGDLDRVIEIWEVGSATNGGTAYARRSLAHAYLMRAGRRWSALSEAELTRIATLMANNLRSPRPSEEDFRLWFEASRQLPSFSMDEALGNLALWSSRIESWRPSYYSSVLNFVLWFQGRTADVEEYRAGLESSGRLAIGRSRNSLLWLGNGPWECPLIGADELGAWDREKSFWRSTEGLRRINGVIDQTIAGPQNGQIVIDGTIKVFFVPAAGNFSKNADEGSEVNFYLGFSPEGPRAWDVRRGLAEGGNRVHLGDADEFEWIARNPVPPRASVPAGDLRERRLSQFVTDILSARSGAGMKTTLDEIATRVGAVFGAGDHGFDKDELVAVLAKVPDLRVEADTLTGRPVVIVPSFKRSAEVLECGRIVVKNVAAGSVGLRRASGEVVTESPSDEVLSCKIGTWVSYSTQNGEVQASTIRVLPTGSCIVDGRLALKEDLPTLFSGVVLARLESAPGGGQGRISLSTAHRAIEMAYSGPSSAVHAAGATTLDGLMATLPGIVCSGGWVFRATSSDTAPSRSSGVRKSAEPRTGTQFGITPQEIVAQLRELARRSASADLNPAPIGQALLDFFGEERYQAWLGQSRLTERLRSVRGVWVTTDRNGAPVVRVAPRAPRRQRPKY